MNPTNHPAGHVLQALHDGELDPNEAAAVQAHCDACADCRNELAELAETVALLATAPAPELPRTVWHRVKPGQTPEPRFKPVFAFAAGAAGVVLGILLGPVQMDTAVEDDAASWSESVTVWNGGATSPLLDVFPTGQD